MQKSPQQHKRLALGHTKVLALHRQTAEIENRAWMKMNGARSLTLHIDRADGLTSRRLGQIPNKENTQKSLTYKGIMEYTDKNLRRTVTVPI